MCILHQLCTISLMHLPLPILYVASTVHVCPVRDVGLGQARDYTSAGQHRCACIHGLEFTVGDCSDRTHTHKNRECFNWHTA